MVSIAFKGGIEPVTAAVTGALLGFLLFNVHPAQVFMGDTGFSGTWRICGRLCLYAENALVIVIVGMIYLIEVSSVIVRLPTLKRPAEAFL